MQSIFTPIKVKGVEFLNRIVMAPMVRFGFECKDGIFGKELMAEYLEAADKNIGLMIGQACSVVPGENVRGGIYEEKHIEYLRTVAEACRKGGTRFFAQLAYPGFAFYDTSPAAKKIESLTVKEISGIRDSFIYAASICKKAGLDGIELHGAHSYFLNMMSSPEANRREDFYGGDIFRRLNLVKEITEGIKNFAKDSFIISYRMGWYGNLETDIKTAEVLEKIGIDMLHISKGIPQERILNLPENFEYNEVVYTAAEVKKHVSIPVIAVNSIKTAERGSKLIEAGCCDFAAYGRPFLASPSFAKFSLDDETYKPCFECPRCKWYTSYAECPARLKKYSYA